MDKEQILDTYESFTYNEDGCDELHYYRDNVLMAMEEYHQVKLKLLGIGDVVGQSEQLFCQNVIHHTCKHFTITGCEGCEVKKFQSK